MNINFEKYDETYMVDFLTEKNGDSLMDCVFSKGEAGTELFKETLMEYIDEFVGKETVLVQGEPCNIFINGIMVKDFLEIGLVKNIECSEEKIKALRTPVKAITGGDIEMLLNYEAIDLSDEEFVKLVKSLEYNFEIPDWENAVKNAIWDYFEDREIKDINGDIVKY